MTWSVCKYAPLRLDKQDTHDIIHIQQLTAQSSQGGGRVKTKWQKYEGTSRALNFPAISVLEAGTLNLNPLAVELLGKGVRDVELLYDPEGKRIGIRPLQQPRPNSRKVSKRKSTSSVNARPFLKQCKVNLKRTTRYRARKDEEGIVVIDLRRPL